MDFLLQKLLSEEMTPDSVTKCLHDTPVSAFSDTLSFGIYIRKLLQAAPNSADTIYREIVAKLSALNGDGLVSLTLARAVTDVNLLAILTKTELLFAQIALAESNNTSVLSAYLEVAEILANAFPHEIDYAEQLLAQAQALGRGGQEEFLRRYLRHTKPTTPKPSYVLPLAPLSHQAIILCPLLVSLIPPNSREFYHSIATAIEPEKCDFQEASKLWKNLFEQHMPPLEVFAGATERVMQAFCEAFISETRQYLRAMVTLEAVISPLLGPLNPNDPSGDCYQSVCGIFGCRMLSCECMTESELDTLEANQDVPFTCKWFVGECQQCGRSVKNEAYAWRYPLPDGSFIGCYCSRRCCIDVAKDIELEHVIAPYAPEDVAEDARANYMYTHRTLAEPNYRTLDVRLDFIQDRLERFGLLDRCDH